MKIRRRFLFCPLTFRQPYQRSGRLARLNALVRFAETRDCRRQPLLAYFGEALPEPCGRCDNCRQTPAVTPTADATTAAQAFLTCVQLTGDRFGAAHVISVLRGSRKQRVLDLRHDRLCCYGAGKDISTEEWHNLCSRISPTGTR